LMDIARGILKEQTWIT